MTILIQNGTILDPSQKLQRRADLLVRDGKVAGIGSNFGKADRVIDAAGRSFEEVFVRVARGAYKIVQFLAEGVIDHEREAMREPVVE